MYIMKNIIFCIFFISPLFGGYSDSFARGPMLAMSAAAYSSDPGKCINNTFIHGKLIKQYTVKCDWDSDDTCSGFTAVSHSDKAIILAFRGTSGSIQLLTEGNDAIFGKKIHFVGQGQVSEYFYNAWQKVWNAGMQSDLLSIRQSYPNYTIWVTGHSLGGSMASIAAAYVQVMGWYPTAAITLYTFGQPRTGDKDFATMHDSILPYSYRVTHMKDMVPHLPIENLEGYHHHKNEVFYNDNMIPNSNFVECDTDESNKCSDGNSVDLSIKDHTHYFDVSVSGYGECGCVCGNFGVRLVPFNYFGFFSLYILYVFIRP